MIDKSYLKTVQNLTKKSIDISNKALGLATVIDDISYSKKTADEKEKLFGLKQKEKPYGYTDQSFIKNNVLIYQTPIASKKTIINFIENLEKYHTVDDPYEKKEILKSIKSDKEILTDNPEKYIINETRASTWSILENNYLKTIKKHNIDSFMQNIKRLRIRYQDDIDYIQNHYTEQQQAYIDMSIARNSNDEEAINTQKRILAKKLQPRISNLVIDTSKVMNRIEFLIEDLPTELNSQEIHELKQFLPAISEYYIDQTYALSGGYSYANISKKLEDLQKDINLNKPLNQILAKVDNLDISMQHLYILHWIAETILKDILQCYTYSCSIGATVRIYNKEYPKAKANFKEILKGIKIRNDIAHNALIWNPKKLSSAIKIYRQYIKDIAFEQKIDLSKYTIPVSNQDLPDKEKEKRSSKIISKEFSIDFRDLKKVNNYLYQGLCQELEYKAWKLDSKRLEYYKNQIEKQSWKINLLHKDTFSKKYFALEYSILKSKLEEFDKNNNTKRVGSFNFIFNKQDDPSLQDNIELIKKSLGI